MEKCFSCGDGMPQTDIQRILFYKELSEKTGIKYIYFDNGKGIGITRADTFDYSKKREYALVTEFDLKKKQNDTIIQETKTTDEQPNEPIRYIRDIPVIDVVEVTTKPNTVTGKRNKRKNK